MLIRPVILQRQFPCTGMATEIPLLMDDTNSPLPTLDSTRLLARMALRRAVQARVVPA